MDRVARLGEAAVWALHHKVLDNAADRRHLDVIMDPSSPVHRASRRPASEGASAPTALGDRAMDDLRLIRRATERGPAFTAVPGWGGVGMGVSAPVAAVLPSARPAAEGWLAVWLAEAVVAVAFGTLDDAPQGPSRRAPAPFTSFGGLHLVFGLHIARNHGG